MGKSCMLHNGLSQDQMDQRFEVITAPDVIDLLMGARAQEGTAHKKTRRHASGFFVLAPQAAHRTPV